MKDMYDNIDYLKVLEEGTFNWWEISVIKEEVAPYLASKQQGEYTIDDYMAIPDDYRVELIDGVIYHMASPTVIHQAVITVISNRIFNFIEKKKGKCIIFCAPLDVQLDRNDKTIVQPDVLVVCNKDKFKNGRVFGAPDFVVEVLSTSTRKKDIYIKTEKYRKAGVREYWMVDTEKERVYVYRFEESTHAMIYTFKDRVPVGIFGGECQMDFSEIAERIRYLEVE